MKCHYKVLEIENDADDSQIKTAYRKLALKWHPDKNLDNGEYAKEQFQLVQQAYEILSDRQERAWYDKHRDQILHERDFEDTALDVFQFFTTTCFKGFGDDDKGFYAVYRQVFEKIAVEDIEHTDEEEFVESPSFGYSTSDYDDVVGPFYSYWMSYNTKRSYSWLNPHNMQEIRDRRIFKLVEKENKKVRLKAKKERNEEVRALVAFVRKRDKRVQENAKRMEAKAIENRQKQEELRKQKVLERQKELNDAKPLAEWTKFDNVENELKGIEKSLAQEFGDLSSDESIGSVDIDKLYCVACNKAFKSAKGFENHEVSKKHKQNVEILKDSMLQEDELDRLSDMDNQASNSQQNGEDNLSDEAPDVEQKSNQKKKKKKAKNVIQLNDSHEDELNLENDQLGLADEDIGKSSFESTNTKKQKRKSKLKNANTSSDILDDVNGDNSNIATDSETSKNTKKGKSKNKDSSEQVLNGNVCATCRNEFPSKNKLFDHLKKTNHGVLLSTANQRNNNIKKINKK